VLSKTFSIGGVASSCSIGKASAKDINRRFIISGLNVKKGNAKGELALPYRVNFLSPKTSEKGKELLEKVLKLALLDEKLFFGDQMAECWYEIVKTGF
jgi:hypothetical protein